MAPVVKIYAFDRSDWNNMQGKADQEGEAKRRQLQLWPAISHKKKAVVQ